MKYALVDNNKTEATKGLKGFCPICEEPVIPICGPVKIDHWAHKSCTHCDKWWENETEWHRNWKDLFPKKWQEVVAFDEKTGEKHIADMKVNDKMVIEFQHSYIKEEERLSREMFYKNMIWVTDGTRRKRDYENFCCLLEYGELWNLPNTILYVTKNGRGYFPKEWQNSNNPVFFDYMGTTDPSLLKYDQRKRFLWCLLPRVTRNHPLSVLICYSKEKFLQDIMTGKFCINYIEISNMISRAISNNSLQKVYIRRQ